LPPLRPFSFDSMTLPIRSLFITDIVCLVDQLLIHHFLSPRLPFSCCCIVKRTPFFSPRPSVSCGGPLAAERFFSQLFPSCPPCPTVTPDLLRYLPRHFPNLCSLHVRAALLLLMIPATLFFPLIIFPFNRILRPFLVIHPPRNPPCLFCR